MNTFEEAQHCQLYHYDVVVIQLAALGFFTHKKKKGHSEKAGAAAAASI